MSSLLICLQLLKLELVVFETEGARLSEGLDLSLCIFSLEIRSLLRDADLGLILIQRRLIGRPQYRFRRRCSLRWVAHTGTGASEDCSDLCEIVGSDVCL